MLFGRDMTLPIDLLIDTDANLDLDQDGEQTCPYVVQLQERLRQIHEYARANTELAGNRQKRNYDRTGREQQLKIGDEVLLYSPAKKKGLSSKLRC